MNKIKPWQLALILLAVLAACWALFFRGGDAASSSASVALATVESGVMEVRVSGSGEIKALKSNKIVPTLKRKATISFVVAEGTRVQAGEIVARFNEEEVLRDIEDLELKIEEQEASVSDRESQLAIQRLENETDLKVAEDKLESSEMEMHKFLKADIPKELREAELKVQTAESEQGRAERRYRDLQDLFKEGFVTEDDVEDGRIKLEEAKVELETSRINRSTLTTYDHPLKTTELTNTVSKSRIDLAKARAQNITLLNNKIRQLDTARRMLETFQRNLLEFREELAHLKVPAPTEGVVNYGDTSNYRHRGDEDVQVGGTIAPGSVLMTIPDLSGMKAVINIPEADIHKLTEAQSCLIRVDAVPDRSYEGQVVKLAEVATSQGWWGTGVKEFEVEISIDVETKLKPGFSCEAEILTQRIEKALRVPIQAVYQERDTFVVYVSRGGVLKPQKVTPGVSTLTHVQILEGLAVGDKVALSRPASQRTADEPKRKGR